MRGRDRASSSLAAVGGRPLPGLSRDAGPDPRRVLARVQPAVRLHRAALLRAGRLLRGRRLRLRARSCSWCPTSCSASQAALALPALARFCSACLSVRHTRIYFSMLTLAFGMMIYLHRLEVAGLHGRRRRAGRHPRAPLEIPRRLHHQRVGDGTLLLRRAGVEPARDLRHAPAGALAARADAAGDPRQRDARGVRRRAGAQVPPDRFHHRRASTPGSPVRCCRRWRTR